MSKYKRLVLTFDAFGTLFTPREPIGKQYVCTCLNVFPIFTRHVLSTATINLPSAAPARILDFVGREGQANPKILIRPMLPEDMAYPVLVMIR